MTRSELIARLWSMGAERLREITGSTKYSVVDSALNKAVIRASGMSDEELEGIRTEEDIEALIRSSL